MRAARRSPKAGRRARADGPLPAGAAVAGPLSRRRPAARRGVHLGFVPAEPDAPRGRHVQRLPRPAHAEAARAGQRGVRAVPPRVEVRRQGASLPSRRHARRRVRQLPHAGDDLHGGRSAPRPQPAGAAARPVGEARHPERLQRVPPRKHGAVVGRLGRALVRRAAAQRGPLRRGDRRRPPRQRGRARGPRRHRHERRVSADRARVGRRTAGALSGPGRRRRGAQRAGRRRSAGAARRLVALQAPTAPQLVAVDRALAERSRAGGSHRGRAPRGAARRPAGRRVQAGLRPRDRRVRGRAEGQPRSPGSLDEPRQPPRDARRSGRGRSGVPGSAEARRPIRSGVREPGRPQARTAA